MKGWGSLFIAAEDKVYDKKWGKLYYQQDSDFSAEYRVTNHFLSNTNKLNLDPSGTNDVLPVSMKQKWLIILIKIRIKFCILKISFETGSCSKHQ